MKTCAVSLILLIALAGCNKCPRAETRESDRPAQPSEITARDEVLGHAWNISAIGLQTTKFLLPYVFDCSADGGSHRYICEVSSNGDIVRQILFFSPRLDHEAPIEVYLLTYTNQLETRKRLSTAEVKTEIGRIEAVLAESGAKDQYDHFYAGGEMSENTSIKEDDDLFSLKIPEKVDLDSEDVKRKMAEAVNQHTLSFIADLVNHYRSTIRRDEQGGAGQPATRPESKSEGSDKPHPESDGRSR